MSSASHSPVTFTQLVALYYSYQRIILVWGACPAVAVLLPLATKCSFFTLDWVTDGHAVLSLFLTAALVAAGHFVMSRLASSKQALQKAYVSNQVRLPFGSCLGGMVASRFLFGPLLAWSGLLARVPVFGNISFVTSLWLAIGLACLGMAVVARYIGPASISKYGITDVRCSQQRGWTTFEFVAVVPSLTHNMHDHSCLSSLYSEMLGVSLGLQSAGNVGAPLVQVSNVHSRTQRYACWRNLDWRALSALESSFHSVATSTEHCPGYHCFCVDSLVVDRPAAQRCVCAICHSCLLCLYCRESFGLD